MNNRKLISSLILASLGVALLTVLAVCADPVYVPVEDAGHQTPNTVITLETLEIVLEKEDYDAGIQDDAGFSDAGFHQDAGSQEEECDEDSDSDSSGRNHRGNRHGGGSGHHHNHESDSDSNSDSDSDPDSNEVASIVDIGVYW